MKLPLTEKTSFATSLGQMQKRCMQFACSLGTRHFAKRWRSSFLATQKLLSAAMDSDGHHQRWEEDYCPWV